MRGEHSQSVRKARVPHCSESNLRKQVARIKSGGRQPRGKAEKQEGENLVEALHNEAKSRRKA
eukprot:6191834-Pleurochrysis_carterae.AAC.1